MAPHVSVNYKKLNDLAKIDYSKSFLVLQALL